MSEMVNSKPLTIGEKELLRQMATVMYAVKERLRFYTEREVNSPSNHQEFAREAQKEFDSFCSTLVEYNEWAKLQDWSKPRE